VKLTPTAARAEASAAAADRNKSHDEHHHYHHHHDNDDDYGSRMSQILGFNRISSQSRLSSYRYAAVTTIRFDFDSTAVQLIIKGH